MGLVYELFQDPEFSQLTWKERLTRINCKVQWRGWSDTHTLESLKYMHRKYKGLNSPLAVNNRSRVYNRSQPSAQALEYLQQGVLHEGQQFLSQGRNFCHPCRLWTMSEVDLFVEFNHVRTSQYLPCDEMAEKMNEATTLRPLP
jgi:hypothetical protein